MHSTIKQNSLSYWEDIFGFSNNSTVLIGKSSFYTDLIIDFIDRFYMSGGRQTGGVKALGCFSGEGGGYGTAFLF